MIILTNEACYHKSVPHIYIYTQVVHEEEVPSHPQSCTHYYSPSSSHHFCNNKILVMCFIVPYVEYVNLKAMKFLILSNIDTTKYLACVQDIFKSLNALQHCAPSFLPSSYNKEKDFDQSTTRIVQSREEEEHIYNHNVIP